MGVIFVAGVHAVGKTTACEKASRSLKIPYYTASGLIRSEKESAISKVGKGVADIVGNQELLIRGVKRVFEQSKSGKIILDGHFTLLKTDGTVETIPEEVFSALELDAIVVFYDEPISIAERLAERDSTNADPVDIEHHQCREMDSAHSIADKLNIPIKKLKAFDDDGFLKLIHKCITHGK
ncbi:ATP-binding protein [Shewanella vesiculosa]|uniref:ATP-binding protein n=1 Tax=Shewanella vesiculosa TaxID=518738 RepID=UPI0023595EA8|nr:ATP-binding protein [Shewanella vesiculosa]NCP76451.1 AAA family ATPase [Shewanella vesiculosa]